MKDTTVIPHGQYCYVPITRDFLGLGKLVTRVCPYWQYRDENHGYCAYLEMADGEGDCFLLWDQVKECGVNQGD